MRERALARALGGGDRLGPERGRGVRGPARARHAAGWTGSRAAPASCRWSTRSSGSSTSRPSTPRTSTRCPRSAATRCAPGQDLLYKGIDAGTSERIYDLLYRRSIDGASPTSRYAARCELRGVERRRRLHLPPARPGRRLHPRRRRGDPGHGLRAGAAAGARPPARARRRRPPGGRARLPAAARATARPSTLFVQNGELHTHGVGAPDLGLGAHRNAVIANALCGREVYAGARAQRVPVLRRAAAARGIARRHRRWERANRELIAKLLTELEFEELLQPGRRATSGRSRSGALTLHYTARRRSLGHCAGRSGLAAGDPRRRAESRCPTPTRWSRSARRALGVDPVDHRGADRRDRLDAGVRRAAARARAAGATSCVDLDPLGARGRAARAPVDRGLQGPRRVLGRTTCAATRPRRGAAGAGLTGARRSTTRDWRGPSRRELVPVHPWQWDAPDPDAVRGRHRARADPASSASSAGAGCRSSRSARWPTPTTPSATTSSSRCRSSTRRCTAGCRATARWPRPRLSAWLRARCAADPFLRETGLILLGEVASVSVAHRAFEAVDGRALPAHRAARRDLARVGRGVPARRASGRSRWPRCCTATRRASAFVEPLIERSGLTVERVGGARCTRSRCRRCCTCSTATARRSPRTRRTACSCCATTCPARLVVKDFVDDMMVSSDPLPELADMPADVRAALGDGVEAAILVQWIQGGLLVCVHRYLAELLEDRLGYPEAAFWAAAERAVARYQAALPGAGGPLRAVRHGGAGVREAVPEPRADARARLRRRRRAAGRRGGRAGSRIRWRRMSLRELAVHVEHEPALDRRLWARPALPEHDTELLWTWMHKPHVVPFWAMDWPRDWIRDYLVRQNEDPARSPLLGFVDDMPVGYIEVYDPSRDVLGAHAPVLPGRHRRARADRRRGAPRPLQRRDRPRRRALPVQAPGRAADRRRARRPQPPVPLAARVPRLPPGGRDRPARQARRVHGLRARGLRAPLRPPPARVGVSLALAGVVKRYGVAHGAGRRRPRGRGGRRSLALLGPNGAGKTTLVAIAARAARRPTPGTRARDAGGPGARAAGDRDLPVADRAREPVGVRRGARRPRASGARSGCSSRSC